MNGSTSLHERALRWMPGGVNSPVRASQAVDQQPVYVRSAQGAYLSTENGQKLIDCVGGFGPAILGHSHPVVVQALEDALKRGFCYGTSSALEVEMAQEVAQFSPTIDQARMVNSGTEACMTAIRLARGCTGKSKIIKFSGCYHGHVDALLVQSGSGCLQHGTPSSPGIPSGTTKDTLLCRFNDAKQLLELCEDHYHDLAAIIVEPIAGNMNMILPKPDFIDALQYCAHHCNALLIADEVMTGFRVHPQGAQTRYSLKPDLTVLGKIIGGGLPVGAIAGPQKWMSYLSPQGPVYQAGTLSGNPLTMTAGLATLKQLKKQNYNDLEAKTKYLIEGLKQRAQKSDIPFQGNYAGGMFGFFFSDTPVECLEDIPEKNAAFFRCFYATMLSNGIHLAPSSYEVGMLSFAHTWDHIENILDASEFAFSSCAASLVA